MLNKDPKTDERNKDLWLILLTRMNEITFRDIKNAVNKISKNPDVTAAEIYQIKMPRSKEKARFNYEKKDPHTLYHLILNDLDAICKRGDAYRTFETEKETGEIIEKYRTTPAGIMKAGQLVLERTATFSDDR